MALTFGIGPLSGKRAGPMNFSLADAPAHRLYLHDEPRRIRALIGDRVVLDTSRAKLLHESNILPRVYAPLEDFDAGLLSRTETTTHCPFKGDASYFTAPGARDAFWTYERPIEGREDIAGMIAPWAGRVEVVTE